MKNLTASILGATGLAGNYCLQYLLQDSGYSAIKVLTRRGLGFSHPKLQEHLIDFEELENFRQVIQSDHLFCCLGTTIKQAGSKADFCRIDYFHPLTLARVARENQVRQFILISALGANEKSKIFYIRTKGELERSIIELQFPGTLIFRPSLLLGERSESRSGEKFRAFILRGMKPFLQGSLKKYRPIRAQTLAVAMVEMAKIDLKGIHIFESDQIQFFSDRLQKNSQAGIISVILPGNQKGKNPT